MGLDPAILNQEHIRRMLSHAERKKRQLPTNAEASAKAEAKSEKELQEQIVNYLHLRGVKRVVRSAMHRKTTVQVGTPDLLLCYHGTACALEVKTPHTGQMSIEQIRAACEFRDDGWAFRIVTSVEDVKKILDSL